jgi:DNA-3-methyladenine glycosylase I
MVATTGPDDQQKALTDSGIIRNRAKVASTVGNAAAFLAVQAELGSFGAYLWGPGRRPAGHQPWTSSDQVPASTPLSEALSADLRRRGLRLVGPTICYACLQATGVVMDHLTSCFRHVDLAV